MNKKPSSYPLVFAGLFIFLILIAGFTLPVYAESRGIVEPESSLDEFNKPSQNQEKPDLEVLALAKQHYLTAMEYYQNEEFERAEEEFNKVLWYFTQARLEAKDLYKLSLIYRGFFKKLKPRVLDWTGDKEVIPSMQTDIGIIVTPEVKKMIKIYQTKRRKEMRGGLIRSKKYLPMIRKIFKEEKIPTDLAYMALVESTFRAKITSRASAQGMWQFMRATGKAYDLKINNWVDERNDPEQSTRAAARYIKSLNEMLGSWLLVQAGYNGGEYRVQRAITRARTRDFWELSRKKYLPYETRYYVYSFMAAVIIAKNPEVYGFTDLEYEKELHYDKINIKDCIDLNVIAETTGVDFKVLKELNPALNSWCTPPDYPEFVLNIPQGSKEMFEMKLAEIPPEKRLRWKKHRVRRGETISYVAKKYGTSVAAIVKASRLRNPNRISIGQQLTIPIGPSGYIPYDAFPNGSDSKRKVTYRIRKGDNLIKIARIFGVRVKDVRKWNNMSASRYIYPGERLTIYTSN